MLGMACHLKDMCMIAEALLIYKYPELQLAFGAASLHTSSVIRQKGERCLRHCLQTQHELQHSKQGHHSQLSSHHRTQHSQPSLTSTDHISGHWHGALETVTAISQQSMPTTQQQANLEATYDAQLHCLLNSLLAVSKTSALALTKELGSAVGRWVLHVTSADGSVHELMAPVLGLQTTSYDISQ